MPNKIKAMQLKIQETKDKHIKLRREIIDKINLMFKEVFGDLIEMSEHRRDLLNEFCITAKHLKNGESVSCTLSDGETVIIVPRTDYSANRECSVGYFIKDFLQDLGISLLNYVELWTTPDGIKKIQAEFEMLLAEGIKPTETYSVNFFVGPGTSRNVKASSVKDVVNTLTKKPCYINLEIRDNEDELVYLDILNIKGFIAERGYIENSEDVCE